MRLPPFDFIIRDAAERNKQPSFIQINNKSEPATPKEDHPFGEDVKMVRQCRLRPKLLTPAEKEDVVAKYKSGMTMTAIANEYRCQFNHLNAIKRGAQPVSKHPTPYFNRAPAQIQPPS
jgi:hypothetical protein